MHRHLIEQGLAAPEKNGTSVRLHRKIGEADLKAYKEETRKRLTAQQAAKHLNICVELLRDLKGADLIETVNDSYCPGPRYHQDQLDEFLKHLGTCLTAPDPDETYIPLNKAAAGLKCKIPRLVRHLMEGKLIATVDVEINGLTGIQIGVNAAKTALHDIDLPGLTRSDAALKLGIRHQTLAWLIDEEFLQTVKMRNPKSGARITAICKQSIDGFLENHITLGLLARKYSRKPGPFSISLEHKGIWPMEMPDGLGKIYKRSRLEQKMLKLGMKPLAAASGDPV